jgi:hypothetical protein
MGGMAVPSAKAADLGGDCCADLEERVAELEATTARKGNRKMSLTISGQVNRQVLFYNDGHKSDAYYGIDNTTSSTRFGLAGNAKVTPKVATGYEILVDIEAGGTSSKLSQLDEDGRIGQTSPAGNGASFNQHGVDSYFEIRKANWWIEHKDVGRVTVGRNDMAGLVQTIDLGGISVVAGASAQLRGIGSMYLRDSAGGIYSATWSSFMDGAVANNRSESIRYDSPALAGFIFSASLGEAGDHYGAMLRYAGEFSGFRVAAGIGYEKSTDRGTPNVIDPTSVNFTGVKPESGAYGGSVAVMHVPSGLFLQGQYNKYFNDTPAAGSHNNSYYNMQAGAKDATHWNIQGGITKNWFGVGNTSLYGEYAQWKDFGTTVAGRDFAQSGLSAAPFDAVNAFQNFTGLADVTSSKVTLVGFGVVQNLDAAATELYLGFSQYKIDVTSGGTQGPSTATAVTGNGVNPSFENHWQVGAGARVKF